VKIREHIQINPRTLSYTASIGREFYHTVDIHFIAGGAGVEVWPYLMGLRYPPYPGCSQSDTSFGGPNSYRIITKMHGWISFEPRIMFNEGQTECPVRLTITVDGKEWGTFDDILTNPSSYIFPTGSWGEWDITVPNEYTLYSPPFSPRVTEGKYYDILLKGRWIEDCTPYQNWWSPMTDIVSMRITAGGEYAWFQPGFEDSTRYDAVSGLIYDDLFYYLLRASRDIPDSINAFFVIETHAGDLARTDTVYINPQDTLYVTFDPPDISPGDTAVIRMQKRVDGELLDVGDYFEIGISEGSEYGTLLRADGDTSDYYPFENIRENDIRFIASKEIKGDTAAATVRVGFYQSNEPADAIREVPCPSGIRWMGKEMRRRNSTEKQKFEVQRSMMETAPEFQYPESGREKIRIRTILLGETKYYQAIPDTNPKNTDKLIFREMHETNGWKRGGDSIKYTVSPEFPSYKLGVYYEFRDNDGIALEKDLIRLVGRYWTPDTTFKVRLKADSEDGKRHGKIVIGVMKPKRLYKLASSLPWYNEAWGIRYNRIDIDSLCIWYGGNIGIPPQVIKGQMFQESYKEGGNFWPSYRYEPWADYGFVHQKNKSYALAYMEQPFWVTGKPPKPMGSGKDIPPKDTPLGHYNVKPIFYTTEPVTIADYVINHWDKYFLQSRDSIIGSKALTDKFRDFLNTYNDILLLSPFILGDPYSIATSFILGDIHEKYTDYAQTRKAASYGFIQMLYTTAQNMGYNVGKSIDESFGPEELNDETIEMPLYKKFTERNLRIDFEDEKIPVIPEANWPKGWEQTWMDSFWIYNSGDGYSASVFNHAKKFYPQSK
jgi:hypothetical protein